MRSTNRTGVASVGGRLFSSPSPGGHCFGGVVNGTVIQSQEQTAGLCHARYAIRIHEDSQLTSTLHPGMTSFALMM